MTWLHLVGAISGLFGLILVVLPAVRVHQTRLTVRQALGLWIAGLGFILFALAALAFHGARANAAVLGGAALAVLGNLLQRREAKRSSG